MPKGEILIIQNREGRIKKNPGRVSPSSPGEIKNPFASTRFEFLTTCSSPPTAAAAAGRGDARRGLLVGAPPSLWHPGPAAALYCRPAAPSRTADLHGCHLRLASPRILVDSRLPSLRPLHLLPWRIPPTPDLLPRLIYHFAIERTPVSSVVRDEIIMGLLGAVA